MNYIVHRVSAGKTSRQTDSHIDGQIERQIERQTDRQTHVGHDLLEMCEGHKTSQVE